MQMATGMQPNDALAPAAAIQRQTPRNSWWPAGLGAHQAPAAPRYDMHTPISPCPAAGVKVKTARQCLRKHPAAHQRSPASSQQQSSGGGRGCLVTRHRQSSFSLTHLPGVNVTAPSTVHSCTPPRLSLSQRERCSLPLPVHSAPIEPGGQQGQQYSMSSPPFLGASRDSLQKASSTEDEFPQPKSRALRPLSRNNPVPSPKGQELAICMPEATGRSPG